MTKVILKFANGATDSFETTAPCVPSSFYIRAGAEYGLPVLFWFLLADAMYSAGEETLLYQECTEEESHRAWNAE